MKNSTGSYGVVARVAILTLVGLRVFCDSNSADKNELISLLTLLPYRNPEPSLDPSWNEGQNIQPALELAQDQINNSSTLLENYTLKLIFAEEGCNQVGRTTVSFVMHADIGRDEKVMGIIGPGCSASTLGLAPLTNRSELGLVMVHGSGSPMLEEKHDEYRYLLGTLGSTHNFVRGFLYLLEEAQWKRIAILYDDSRPYHLDTQIELTEEITTLSDVKIDISSPVSFTHLPLEVIKHSLIRIIYVLCPTELSQRILCLSHHNNMIYSNYQWVYVSQIQEQLARPIAFMYEGMQYNCSEEEMTSTLEKMFLLIYKLVPSAGETPISNMSHPEYLDHYKKYREQYNKKSSPHTSSDYTIWATYLYDAVWAWGLVLDNLTKSDSFEISTEYGNLTRSRKIVEQFYDTTFQGMSGRINFNRSTGFTDRQTHILQVVKGNEENVVVIGETEEKIASLHLISDSFPVVQENIAIGTVFTLLVLSQLLVGVCLHIITAFNFKKPSIKASNPKMLHISYIGTYVLVMGALIYALKSVPSIYPQARCWLTLLIWAWFLPVGSTLAFGSVTMRTWRVYRIFVHYINPGPFISDHVLFGGIGLLLLADMIVGITWTAIDPLSAENISIVVGASMNVKSVCNCEYYRMWLTLVIAHKVGLLILVSVLALLTRNIPNRSFTTNALRVLTYVTSIIFGLGFSLYYVLRSSGFDSSITMLVLLNLIICAFIACIFVPPVTPMLRTYYQKLGTKLRTHS